MIALLIPVGDVVRALYFVGVAAFVLTLALVAWAAWSDGRKPSSDPVMSFKTLVTGVVGQSLLVLGTAAEAYIRVNTPPTWRVFVYPGGLACLLVAGVSFYREQNDRLGRKKRREQRER